MTYSLPFDKPGRFWKGNIHAHSTLSDGQLAPGQVCKRYEDAGYDKNDSWHFLDILTDKGKRLHAIATDDAHFTARYQDFQRGWVHVKSENLEPDSLANALKAGHFYSSTGPQFDRIRITDQGIVHVQCSPVERIFLTGKGSKAQRQWGDGITDAAFDLSECDSPWCRVSIRDKSGNRAWSNPIWLDGSGD